MPEPGMVHVYTGAGKGKTTAALGLTVRARGRGLSVLIVQFMKGNVEYGELDPLRDIGVEIVQFGRPDFVDQHDPDPVDVKMAQEGLDYAIDRIGSGDYDMVVLDEINVATSWKLVSVEDVLDLIEGRPEKVELVLTGRYAPEEFIEAADLVTEMVEVKHYFRKGTEARDGVER